MEHIERAGVHSGDSMAVYPPQTLPQSAQDKMVEYAIQLAKALGIIGLMNIQFVLDGDDVQVIEVNPRASRTVPYLSKITGVPDGSACHWRIARQEPSPNRAIQPAASGRSNPTSP